jgi:hypothetical protein
MDVGITVPQTPVSVAPGTDTRIRVDLRNRSGTAVSVRLSVAHSRAGAWAEAEPPVLDLDPGGSASADLVFRPPSGVEAVATLLPFTVQAEDMRLGVITGRATGLLTVAPQERLTAELHPESSKPGLVVLQVRLGNRDDAPLTLKMEPKLESESEGRVDAVPAVIDVPGGEMATARIRVRPGGRMSTRRSAYNVSVACKDVAAPADWPPLAILTDSGTVPPRFGPRFTVPFVLVLLLAAAAGAALATGRIDLPDRIRPGGGGGPDASVERIAKPYAVAEVFLKEDPAGRQAAEQAVGRMKAAGMSVRLVDSTTSPDLADGGGGLWVVLQDGFGTLGEAQAYCDRFRVVAPKCEAVP